MAFLKNRKDKEKKILIKIPSEIKYIRKVSFKILSRLSPYEINENTSFDIRLCTEEATRNAIVHGNKSNGKLSVKISCWIEDDKINIEVEDEGSGFDHRHLSDPTEGDNIMRNCGRGIYLIKKLMDSVEFNDAGNKIKMMKSLK